jgi:hypothetical protein
VAVDQAGLNFLYRQGTAWRAMTIQYETAMPAVDFPVAAGAALRHAGRRSGLDTRGARLIRLFATAVYRLPAVDAVARIAVETSPDSVARLDTVSACDAMADRDRLSQRRAVGGRAAGCVRRLCGHVLAVSASGRTNARAC